MTTINRESLYAALRAAERATAKRDYVPLLNGVLLDARSQGFLTVTGTDLELAIRVTVPSDGDGGWARVVNARLLTNLVGRMSGDTVDLQLRESTVVVLSGGVSYDLASSDAGDFPDLPAVDAKATVGLPAGTLVGVLNRVVFAAAEGSQRPILSGVYVELARSGELTTLALTATDSSRLATETIVPSNISGVLDGPVTAILPKRSTEEAIPILERAGQGTEATLEIGQKLAALRVGDYVLTTRLIEGMYPPFRQVLIVDPAHRVTFERGPLVDALSRLSVLARKGPAVVVFEPGDAEGMVALRAREADVGEGIEALRIGGQWPEDYRASYQIKLLEGALKAVSASEIVCALTQDPNRQSQWTVPGSDWKFVLMPVRLS